ncbi:tumor necrosis factor receptor superfamily member 16 [Ictalurus furcatus]|uniref:tumor necrosis factor receptor superfamily member 16 n=1 Tax=Ictalurus furcatus TaxID=66913 RepID=UPI002350E2C1|nr:tumor necrosis factor receptor superfamily member 16 [Ictalurus furcatus]
MKFVAAVLSLSLHITALKVKVVEGDVCASGKFTSSGECCSLCPQGMGVASNCELEDTKCQPCLEGVTFSGSEGLSGCQPCSQCPLGVPQLERCTITEDTHCDCGKGFFLWKQTNETDALCAPCATCGRGEGVVRACGPAGNTVCQPCGSGTFSEDKSYSQTCMPCSRCREDEVEIRPCQAKSDTLCMDRDLHIFSRNGSEGPWEFPRRPGSADEEHERKNKGVTGSEAPDLSSEDHQGGNNIIIYVSVLAAVVLGLLIYVAYKCWKSFQQKAALGKARAAELNNVVEGEKLHSDSGVFLDSHSLQENQPSKGSKQDTRYINLPPQRQEEVEKLLSEGGSQSWRQLAGVLGYEQERADMFGRGEDPVHTLLTDWAQQDSSTLELLSTALSNIERHDVAKALSSTSQGITMV